MENDTRSRNFPELTLPQVGQTIEIGGREGIFIVLRTDADRGTVDVLKVSGIRHIEAGIRADSVQVLEELYPLDPLRQAEA